METIKKRATNGRPYGLGRYSNPFVGAGIARPFPTVFAAPNCLPLERKVSAKPADEVIFQRQIQIKQAEIASARPAAYSVVSTAVSTPGNRNKCIDRRLNAPTKKPVGETPTGGALFDYVSGVTSGAGSSTIVNTKVFGKAKKSPPRTLAVTMYLPGAVGMVLFA